MSNCVSCDKAISWSLSITCLAKSGFSCVRNFGCSVFRETILADKDTAKSKAINVGLFWSKLSFAKIPIVWYGELPLENKTGIFLLFEKLIIVFM